MKDSTRALALAALLALILAGGCKDTPPEEEWPDLEVSIGGDAWTAGDTFDFGSVVLGESSEPATVTVKNTGTAELELTGSPTVAITGTAAADFDLVQPALSVLGAGESATFSVTFSPSALGAGTATITVSTNVPEMPSFSVTLAGEGVPVPVGEINVRYDGSSLASGATTGLGNVTVGQTGPSHTFTIESLGTGDLVLSGNPDRVAKSGTDKAMFLVTQPSGATVVPGATTTFSVSFSPTSMGVKSCTLLVPSNDADEGTYSIVLTAEGTQTPSAPTGLVASAVLDDRIDLTWTDTSSIEEGFHIDRSDDGGSSWAVAYASVAADQTSYSDTGLPLFTTYTYRVCAYNGYGDSDYSSEDSASTDFPAPSGLSAAGVGVNAIDLAWTDESDVETGFRVERSPDGSSWAEIAIVTSPTTSYRDLGLAASTTRSYRVRAYRAAEYSDYSPPASAASLPVWSVETVDSSANIVGKYSSLRLTSDSPRIAYYDATAARPKYASYGGSWSAQTLDSVASGQYASLALSGSAYPRISYYDSSVAPHNLRYAEYNGSAWSYTSLDQDASADTGKWSALALDGSGNPSITYWSEYASGAGTFAKNVRYSGGWQTAVRTDAEYTFRNNLGGEAVSFSMAGSTRHACYSGMYWVEGVSDNRYALVYSTSPDGATWTPELVTYKASGVASNPYQYTSIASSGTTVYIAYYDSAAGDLYVVKRTAAWGSPVSAQSTNDVGQYCSLAVDGSGGLHLSYYNATGADLCYTYSSDGGTTWSSAETVDSTGTVGQYASVVAGTDEYPRIAYYDATNGNLKYARKNKPLS